MRRIPYDVRQDAPQILVYMGKEPGLDSLDDGGLDVRRIGLEVSYELIDPPLVILQGELPGLVVKLLAQQGPMLADHLVHHGSEVIPVLGRTRGEPGDVLNLPVTISVLLIHRSTSLSLPIQHS